MRQAFNDVGWLTNPQDASEHPGAVFGFSLGYDFAAQHEYGVPFLREALGLPDGGVPVGIEDRTMTKVPDCLGFVEYEHRSADRRSKRTMPAALLHCSDHARYVAEEVRNTPSLLAKSMDAEFIWDFVKDKGLYRSAEHDVVCAWAGREGFAIHVRGAENVSRLRELHEALLAKKVSLADPVIVGFSRKALALVMHEKLPTAVVQSVREKDEAYLRLQQAAQATGVEEVLRAAGLDWRALRPEWVGDTEGRLKFWLNSGTHRDNHYGWFSEQELRQWAQGYGPVVDSREIETLLKANDPNWAIHLLAGLREKGVAIERGPEFVWLDKAANSIGVVLELAGNVAGAGLGLPDNAVYPLTAIEPFVARGVDLRREPATSAT